MIIVGGQKQLPPQTGLRRIIQYQMLDDDVEVEYSESILELADKVIGSKLFELRWHIDRGTLHLLTFQIFILRQQINSFRFKRCWF